MSEEREMSVVQSEASDAISFHICANEDGDKRLGIVLETPDDGALSIHADTVEQAREILRIMSEAVEFFEKVKADDRAKAN